MVAHRQLDTAEETGSAGMGGRMKVYLVWMRQHYEPSYLLSIHLNREKALAECDSLTANEDMDGVWYGVEEMEVQV
jgi:hypothetical protein